MAIRGLGLTVSTPVRTQILEHPVRDVTPQKSHTPPSRPDGRPAPNNYLPAQTYDRRSRLTTSAEAPIVPVEPPTGGEVGAGGSESSGRLAAPPLTVQSSREVIAPPVGPTGNK